MSSHPFDSAVALQPQADGTFLGHTSPAYANMVGPFGGITAAQALNAALLHPQLHVTIEMLLARCPDPLPVQRWAGE